MNSNRTSRERGQTLVLVVLGFIAFVAVLALVLDGGNAYAAKRSAQNAADAGALAGAQYMCLHMNDDPNVIDNTVLTAQEYAGLNDADDFADVVADPSAATVVVNATVTKDTFFAGVIGFDTVSPRAVAEAACRPPGVGVLPVAWSCRETVVGEIKCTEDLGPCRTLSDPTGMKCTYVLMDSVKVREKNKNCDPNDPDCYTQNDLECSVQAGIPPNCAPTDPTKIDCDLDNDCVDDLAAGGSRSWLDLDGGGGGGKRAQGLDLGCQTSRPNQCPHLGAGRERCSNQHFSHNGKLFGGK